MYKLKSSILAATTATLFAITPAFAITGSGDLAINSDNIRFSTSSFLEGQQARVYATVSNLGTKDLLGVVRFYNNGSQINGDQAISIFKGKTDDIFIDFTPRYGNNEIKVQIIPWEADIDDPSNNVAIKKVFALQDTDRDGIDNKRDDDDDNDGVLDVDDAFPIDSSEWIDTDGDGLGNNADQDDDNDEVPDEFDDMPLDPTETIDTDGDGIGNIADTDDDNDGLEDADEEKIKTDPLNPDTDSDTYNDKEDAFPLDPNEWIDTDHDQIGNNTDIDDDNDGVEDINDKFPLNKGPKIVVNTDLDEYDLYETVTFDASDSEDQDGDIVKFIWTIDDIKKEGNRITHQFKKVGKHNIKLEVTDDKGETKTIDYQASVSNITLRKEIIASLFSLLLAILIFLKYISGAKKHKEN